MAAPEIISLSQLTAAEMKTLFAQFVGNDREFGERPPETGYSAKRHRYGHGTGALFFLRTTLTISGANSPSQFMPTPTKT
jgi:hypothetical protein